MSRKCGTGWQETFYQNVVIEGSTVYGAVRSAPYSGQIGKQIPRSTRRASPAGSDRYRADGYILSQTVVPPQSFIGGTLKIRVVENIQQRSDRGDARDSYRNLLQSTALT